MRCKPFYEVSLNNADTEDFREWQEFARGNNYTSCPSTCVSTIPISEPIGYTPSDITTTGYGGRPEVRRPRAARRFWWERLARWLRFWTSASHPSSSSGPNRSLGTSSRTTRYTWGRVIRGIFFPKPVAGPAGRHPPADTGRCGGASRPRACPVLDTGCGSHIRPGPRRLSQSRTRFRCATWRRPRRPGSPGSRRLARWTGSSGVHCRPGSDDRLPQGFLRAGVAWLLRHLKELGAKVGTPDITFHKLRHFHAALALNQGNNHRVVSRRLGHSKVSITMDLYGHALPGWRRDLAENVASAIDGEGPLIAAILPPNWSYWVRFKREVPTAPSRKAC